MQIRLKNFFVKNLNFAQVEQPQDGESDLDFNYDVLFYKEKTDEFYLIFQIDLKSPSEFNLGFNYLFVFGTDESLDNEFIHSHFPVVNAPAIAFPYIRTFISNFTLNSGCQPAIVPSINFIKFQKGKVFVDGVLISEISDQVTKA